MFDCLAKLIERKITRFDSPVPRRIKNVFYKIIDGRIGGNVDPESQKMENYGEMYT